MKNGQKTDTKKTNKQTLKTDGSCLIVHSPLQLNAVRCLETNWSFGA